LVDHLQCNLYLTYFPFHPGRLIPNVEEAQRPEGVSNNFNHSLISLNEEEPMAIDVGSEGMSKSTKIV
jgi:hypothetical protein